MADVPNIFKQPLVEATQITFWWNAPTSDGGSPITSYILCNASPPLSYTYSADTRSAFVRSLTINTSYSFQVAASNALGLGSFASFNTVTTGFRPLPLSSLSNIGLSSNVSNASFIWSQNPGNFSNNLLGQVLTAKPFDISGIEVSSSTIRQSYNTQVSSGFLQNLAPFTLNCSVQAANSVGYSPITVSSIIDNVPGSAVFTASAGPPILFSGLVLPQYNILLGTNSFTVEWFQYITTLGSGYNSRIFSAQVNGIQDAFGLSLVEQSGQFRYRLSYVGNTGPTSEDTSLQATSNILSNWNHIALVGTSNAGPPFTTRMSLYVSGSLIFSSSNNYNFFSFPLTQPTIGYPSGSAPNIFQNALQGYITSFRFITDAALYSGSNYTRVKPPFFTSPTGTTQYLFPFYSSDHLLSNETASPGVDINIFASQLNNANYVTFLKAFPGYSVPAVGGSIFFSTLSPNYTYFNASIGANQPIGTSNFTMEWFQNLSPLTTNRATVFSMRTSATEYFEVAWQLGNNPAGGTIGQPLNVLVRYPTTTGGTTGAFTSVLTPTIQNAWVHVALVTNLSSANLTLYINGSSVGTFNNYQGITGIETVSVFSIGNTTGTGAGGFSAPSFSFQYQGYLTNMRLTNGARVYTTNFTKPTPPLSAFGSGTCELLLLATNSGSFNTDSGLRARTLINQGIGTPAPVWNSNYPS